jgi:hypothetical protein
MKARQHATPERCVPRVVAQHEPANGTHTQDEPLNHSHRQLAQRRTLDAVFGPGSQRPTVQRMVAIAAEDMNAVDDALVLNNLDYARGHFGDPVGDFKSNRKFGQTKPGDRLGIVAHGSPGNIAGYGAEAVADVLTAQPGPINKELSSIVLYSCNAGMDQDKKGPDTSLVHGLSAALNDRGYEIGVEGLKGIGFGFKGIGERTTKGTEAEGDKAWFDVRDAMFRRPAYQEWGKPRMGFVTADKLLKVAGKYGPEQIAKMSLLDKAAALSDIMAPFWREVEAEMGTALYDHLKGWVRVMSYAGGGQLVQDTR